MQLLFSFIKYYYCNYYFYNVSFLVRPRMMPFLKVSLKNLLRNPRKIPKRNPRKKPQRNPRKNLQRNPLKNPQRIPQKPQKNPRKTLQRNPLKKPQKNPQRKPEMGTWMPRITLRTMKLWASRSSPSPRHLISKQGKDYPKKNASRKKKSGIYCESKYGSFIGTRQLLEVVLMFFLNTNFLHL